MRTYNEKIKKFYYHTCCDDSIDGGFSKKKYDNSLSYYFANYTKFKIKGKPLSPWELHTSLGNFYILIKFGKVTGILDEIEIHMNIQYTNTVNKFSVDGEILEFIFDNMISNEKQEEFNKHVSEMFKIYTKEK